MIGLSTPRLVHFSCFLFCAPHLQLWMVWIQLNDSLDQLRHCQVLRPRHRNEWRHHVGAHALERPLRAVFSHFLTWRGICRWRRWRLLCNKIYCCMLLLLAVRTLPLWQLLRWLLLLRLLWR